MADDRFPNDPHRPAMGGEDYSRAARRDSDLQADPELREGPASGGKIALFAVAIALVLGAVFYGLNHSSTNEASNGTPAQTAQKQPANPAAPPGSATPRSNTQPGVTTGAAQNPPQPAPNKPQSAPDNPGAAK